MVAPKSAEIDTKSVSTMRATERSRDVR